jgi:hypothetical protein
MSSSDWPLSVLRYSLFWHVTQSGLIVVDVSGQHIGPISKGQKTYRLSWNIVTYQSKIRNITEEQRFQLYRGGSLKSRNYHFRSLPSHIPGDQNVSVHMMITVQKHKNSVYSNNPHTTDDLKMTITEYIRNADRAILNTVLENTVRRVNKCLETGGGHFEYYL